MGDAHLLAAAKLAMFSLVGLGWLSLREYLGALPVADAAVLITVVVLASVNLVLALLLPTTDLFAGPAKALFSEVLALCVVYAYSLLQSAGSDPLNCAGGAYTFQATWAACFFGGLPMHEAAGGLTMAFLLILLVVAAGQVRACTREPGEWLAPGTGQAVLIPLAVQLALLVFRAPLSNPETGLAGILMAAVGLMCLLMPRLDWLGGMAQSAWFGERVQLVFEVALTCLVLLLGLCVAGFTAGGFPLGLFLAGAGVLVGEVAAYNWEPEEEFQQFPPSAPAGVGARMMVPELRVLTGRMKKSR